MGNVLANEKQNDELRVKLKTITGHYTKLYEEWEEAKQKNVDLRRQLELIQDDKNVQKYLHLHKNGSVEQYHAYLKSIIR